MPTKQKQPRSKLPVKKHRLRALDTATTAAAKGGACAQPDDDLCSIRFTTANHNQRLHRSAR